MSKEISIGSDRKFLGLPKGKAAQAHALQNLTVVEASAPARERFGVRALAPLFPLRMPTIKALYPAAIFLERFQNGIGCDPGQIKRMVTPSPDCRRRR